MDCNFLGKMTPSEIVWHNRFYKIKKIGLYHKTLEGNTLFHIFSVVTDSLFFRLKLNSKNLIWTLEEISDGLPH